ncbi:TlpA family protein disulfide reductase [Planctomycetota bacterium]|nr:TlpA family protein disulfide reductase [Planctomycetota bacterium]
MIGTLIKTGNLICLTLVAAVTVTTAQPAAPGSGGETEAKNAQLQVKVEQAYRETYQYQAKLDYHFDSKAGRWKRDERGEFFIAYDRSTQRLKIDAPGVFIVIKDGKLFVKSEDLRGRYLETEAPSPLTFASLLEATTIRGEPLLSNPTLHDVAFLIGDDPILEMTEWTEDTAEILPPAKGDKHPRMRIDLFAAATTLKVDPDTNLITSAIDVTDMTMLTGNAQSKDFQNKRYKYIIEKHNQPIDDAQFIFDPEGAKRFTNFESLVTDIFGSASSSNSSGPQPDDFNAPLKGKPAVEFTAKNLQGDEILLHELLAKDQVVILDFWATWCPPCRAALPEMEKLQKWADENDKPVQIYTVNAGEDEYTVQTFWDENDMSLPVIMDTDGQIMELYQVPTIPHTFIIVDGNIEHIHAGFVENMSDELANKIEELLTPKPEIIQAKPDAEALDHVIDEANQSGDDSTNQKPKKNKPKRAPAAPL